MNSTLYLTSVPIGNSGDLSPRCLETIQTADLIIGEEFKTTSKLLKYCSTQNKDFELLNEHTDIQSLEALLQKVKSKEKTCLFSDSGTPLLADPGQDLVKRAIQEGISIKVIPGPSAFLVALLLSGLSTSPFTFIGFLPRESVDRLKTIKKYMSYGHTLVLYETPYRYKKSFREILEIFPKNTKVFLGLDLTCEGEIQFRGTKEEFLQRIEGFPKGNPVLVISAQQ
jgi:16S rRNA (cytidine1402-2'-O)-methyltransferase